MEIEVTTVKKISYMPNDIGEEFMWVVRNDGDVRFGVGRIYIEQEDINPKTKCVYYCEGFVKECDRLMDCLLEMNDEVSEAIVNKVLEKHGIQLAPDWD